MKALDLATYTALREKIRPIVLSTFLVLTLWVPAMLRAQTPGSETVASLPEVKTYEELRHAISEARAASRVRVEKAVEQERVREAWETGRLIDAHVLQHKERAGYDRQVLDRLAQDLGTSGTELYYALEFYRTYPIVRPAGQLSWSHYQALLAVNDPRKRQALAAQAEKENWNRARLREEVGNVNRGGKAAPEETLVAQPGELGTYRVILAKAGPYAGKLALDLGFSNYIRLAEIAKEGSPFKEGDIVVSSRDTKGNYSLELQTGDKRLRESDSRGSSPESPLFTYPAYVYKVLDGDTLQAVVDLGFGFTTTQTLRLRGIDAPEIQTRDGMEAREFVEKMLARSPQVLIKTVKSDKYDRYLADVFIPARSLKASAGGTGATGHECFSDKDGKQQYLNNRLLEEGHAVRVRE